MKNKVVWVEFQDKHLSNYVTFDTAMPTASVLKYDIRVYYEMHLDVIKA